MKAYMIKSRKTIEPFKEHPRDCLIANRKLRDLQESVLESLDIELILIEDSRIQDQEEHIFFTDSLYFNRELLIEFISRSRELRRNTVCALKPGTFTLRTIVATQDVAVYDDRVEYDLHYVPAGDRSGEILPVIIEGDALRENLRMPEQMLGTPGYEIPLPDKVAIQIDHWTNLWAANIRPVFPP